VKRYHDLNTWFRARFDCRVQKITLDAGFTCPNRDGTRGEGGCAYCNAQGSGTAAHVRGLSVTAQLQAGIRSQQKRSGAGAFVAYFQSYTNTYAPIDTLRRLYDEAIAVPGVVGLSIGTRPDCLEESVIALLHEYAKTRMVWVELGLQSAHDTTLARINRGHDVASFVAATKAARAAGLLVCAHLIIGLPGESAAMVRQTADTVAELAIDGVKIHLLYVVKGTRMAQWYEAGEYRCLTREEYVEQVCDTLERLPWNTVIQRLTGDPHPDELVAPQWALEKGRNLAALNARLEERDTWQGRLRGAPCPTR
jgi:uncharacterized protein